MYKQNKFLEARDHFDRSVKNISSNDKLLEQALFNHGNSCMQLEEFESAIKSYRKALELNEEIDVIKKNLELAKKLLEQKKQKEKEQKKEQDKEDKKDKKDKQNDKNDDQKKIRRKIKIKNLSFGFIS